MHAAVTDERRCWRCRADVGDALVCAGCEAPQALSPDTDLFRVLGLPRNLVVDGSDLERRWHDASRLVHPDRHQAASPQAGALAVTLSAAVNRAYRTLRDPLARARYWLELHGTRLGDDNNRVPPALAALVFETQEKLEELAGGADVRDEVESVRTGLGERLSELERDLAMHEAGWDRDGTSAAPATLAELKRRVSDINYLRSLLGDVDAALGA
jgi:molecular chaperone HscB